MSTEPKPPVLWTTVITRWAVAVLLLVVIVIALRPTVATWLGGERKHFVSGDGADIQLVGVAPDGEDILFDPRGRPHPTESLRWPGERTYTWPQQQVQRDFLFELGPGTENLEFPRDGAGAIGLAERRGWIQSSSMVLNGERVPAAGGRARILLRANLSQNYWRRGSIFGGNSRPLEEVNVSLSYYPPQRARAWADFDGPFQFGVTNRARERSPVFLIPLTNVPPHTSRGAAFRMWANAYGPPSGQLLAYDTDGKRHFVQTHTARSGPSGWTNEFTVSGVPLSRVTAVTLGELMLTKTFHNVVVNYPGRQGRTHSPVLDRLAVALGKTNQPASALEHYSPRNFEEALVVLDFRPANQNAMSYLAHSGRTTNFTELPPDRREKLRRAATAMLQHREPYARRSALRAGLRGGWPEFTALALQRLTNGPPEEQRDAAYALAPYPRLVGAEHVAALAALARTNDQPGLGETLVRLIGAIRAPEATNALLELSRADPPWLWWPAIAVLRTKLFEPLAALNDEMQQRVVLVRNLTNAPLAPGVLAAARARLPALCTIEIREQAPGVHHDVIRSLGTFLDRATAMETMAKYLRAHPPDHWKSEHPMDLVQQINAWYGKDFGGIGDGKKSGYSYPNSEAWPSIIEDVLEFHDRLKRDGKVETGR